MNKFAVAVHRLDEDNKVVIVDSEDELTAMMKAVGDVELWGITDNKPPFKTVDEGITFYLQGDAMVSKPVAI
ncbi:hypothetical protein MOD67_13770 [Bacillus licheniformis]|uniref:hypothetical protein n=1 Tax=Bacillus TaxID=1386 RepID=UPI0020C87A47|nr:hypothetical protein [Bacillus haynesii]MCP8973119.1 hypothetical protein [Bacillus licheniformis]MCY7861090.1 hypothetical protein [Bacillus haynesii]MCY8015581.1 hypothetical protein [Bacillus haynesii]MCY8549204.1 hypothetical protein [Bacillus haynesii]MCY8745048.1 hypothetical protein [Bacillus licheniformis]